MITLPLIITAALRSNSRTESDDAVLVVKDGVQALWDYRQLPMRECRWCGRTVNLNRHHVVPQAANPALRDVRENLIVLCRDCHFVLGHRCDWHRYNPDVMYMCTTFTNVVYSADTRFGITNVNVATPPVTNVYETPRVPLSVTNDVPASQREALRRILES